MPLKLAKPVRASDPAYSETYGVTPQPAAPEGGHKPPAPPAAVEPYPPREEPPTAPEPVPATAAVPTTPARAGGTVARAGKGRRAAQRAAPPVMVNVKVRPLAAQAERIEAAGLPMQAILRAAWRQATTGLKVGAGYVGPAEAERADEAHALYRTTIRVDAAVLAELARLHDPYGVVGRWSLIRGQIEERFWQAVDDVLGRFAPSMQAGDGAGAGRAR